MGLIATSSSITHTYGNVACVAMEYIKSYFKSDFFKTIHMSTKMSYRQLDVFKAKHGFWVNPKPMLIMKPRILPDESDIALYGSAMTSRITNIRYPTEFTKRVPVITDRKYGVELSFSWNRLRLGFDVAIVLGTFNQQINIRHTMKNRMIPESYDYINTPLEACVPKSLMSELSKHLGFKSMNVNEMLYYLNTYGAQPFTYKLKSGSGKEEFFLLYDTNIEFNMSGLSEPDEGESRGLATDTFVINFTVTLDFYGVGTWYLGLVNNDNSYKLAPSDAELNPEEDNNVIIPLMSIPLGFDLHLEDGWRILNSPCFFVSSNGYKKGIDDITSFKDAISPEFIPLLHKFVIYNKYTKVPLEPFIKFRCFKGRRELTLGENGYMIDLEKMEIHVYDCNPKETYRLFILINTLMINTIASEVNNFDVPK